MERNHFIHPHTLVLVEHKTDVATTTYCSACGERVEGSCYNCSGCEFWLHKSCAELPREINHPFHLDHPLILYEMRPMRSGWSSWFCSSCSKTYISGESLFAYRCSSCDFDLDIRCALLPNLITGDLPKLKHFSHQHSLLFIQNHYIETQAQSCSACEEPISGPVYCCFDCRFFLHQKCFELPLVIKHPSHHKHPLTLQPKPPPHAEKCSCHLCTKAYKGFIYYCSLCELGIMIKYTFSDHKTIKSQNHEHPFILISRPLSFFCEFCGTDGKYCFPYVCIECGITIHKDCILLPQKIKITTHEHPVSHIYFLSEYEGENKECRICWDEINMGYGSYHCRLCDYYVHVNCATNEFWWDKEYFKVTEGSLNSNEALEMLSDEWASITRVFKKERRGEDEIAIEIKHFSHPHNLMLSDEIKDDVCCDGCIRPISTEFYYCAEDGYSLHKCCAELRKKSRHWAFKKPLTLCYYAIFRCILCGFYCCGFGYKENIASVEFIVCIRCFQVPQYFTNRGHKHRLFCDPQYKGEECSGCGTKHSSFRCKAGDFFLGYGCVVLPHTTWYKYDKHPLALTYHDDRVGDQCFCEICEEPRDPKKWFYYCEICDYSVHPSCVLGNSPYVKLGLTSTYDCHPHPLTFVKEDFDYFECDNCCERCKIVFAKCSKSDCKYALHLGCLYYLLE